MILNIIAALDVENTVDVDTRLELANHEVLLAIGLDVLDGEASDPGVDLSGELLGLGISGLEVEGLLSVEGENLGGGHDVALVEDGQAGILVGNIGGLLPAKLDGVADDVLNGEVSDTENGGEDGAAEGGTTGKSFVGVEGEGEGLAEEFLDALLEGRQTRATADNLDDVDVFLGETGLGKGLLEGNVGAGKEGLDHGLELLSGDHGGSIDVVHERLDVDGGLLVGGEDLLGLFSGGDGSGHGTSVCVDVDLVLALELLGEVVNESAVEVSTTKVAVPGGSPDRQLALLELDNGDGVTAVTDVDEGNTSGDLVGAGKVQLGDTPAKSGSGVVVDESEKLEASNLGSVKEGASLNIGEPWGNAHADVGDGKLELGSSSLSDLAQVHGNELSGREFLLLTKVVDLGTNLAVDIAKGSGNILLLDLDLGVVE